MNYGTQPLNIPPEADQTPQTQRTIRAITEAGLPALRGSEAEIAEAAEIRVEKLIAADDLMTALRINEQRTELGDDSAIAPERPVTPDEVREAQAALNRLRHQEEAAWWIAHRAHSPEELLALFADPR